MARSLFITDALYKNDYIVNITFNTGETRLVDFARFFATHSHPQYNRYKTKDNFKQFKIAHGNIVWGNDWDLMFPIEKLYKTSI